MKREISEESPEAYNFKVREGLVYDEHQRPIYGRKAIYIDDPNDQGAGGHQCLGIHSNAYGIVQYPDLKDAVDNAMAIGMNLDMEQVQFDSYVNPSSQTKDEFDNKTKGGRCVMRWRLPQFNETELTTGDTLAYVFRVSGSHDGGWSILNETEIERVACMNGWVRSQMEFKCSFKHTKNVDIEVIVKRINQSLAVFKEGVKEYGELFGNIGQVYINHYEGINILRNMSIEKGERTNIEHLWTAPWTWRGYEDHRRPAIEKWAQVAPSFRSTEIGGRDWKEPMAGDESTATVGDLFNCITQHLTHTCQSRVYSAVRGQKAFSQLLEYVRGERDSNSNMKLRCEAPPRTRNMNRVVEEENPLVVHVGQAPEVTNN